MDEEMLSDGFDSLPADESMTDDLDPVEDMDTEEADEPTRESEEPVEAEQETPLTEPQKIKIKFDREEKELSVEEAAQLAQKGLGFDRAVERAKQEARDAYIAEQGHVWNGQPIRTEAEYRQAVAEQQLIEQYKDRELPDELIQEIMAGRRDREERAKEREAQEAKAKKDADAGDFLAYFKSVNDRDYDANKDSIPQTVWDAVNSGTPLRFAYMEHHNKELQKQLKIAKQNESNQKKAPVGSVTSNGSVKQDAEDDWFSKGL